MSYGKTPGDSESPLKVAHATKERVLSDPEVLFGDRRWVTTEAGTLTERYGPGHPGETTCVQTIGAP